MNEIVYTETQRGLFEPVPTRAQKRRTKAEAESRKRRRDEWLAALGFVLLFIACLLLGMWEGHLMTMH